MITLRKARVNDLQFFYPHEDDRKEAVAANIDWQDSLVSAVENGCVVVTLGELVLAFGGNDGQVCWFVTDEVISDLVLEDKVAFRKVITEHRDGLLKVHGVLQNYVWTGNTNHIRFLKTIGATFQNSYRTNPETNEKFQLFTIGG